MCLDRSLRDVQIVSDFRVVTPLKQQIDNLPLPWSHLIEFLFHNHYLIDAALVAASGSEPGPRTHLDSGHCVSFCIHAAKSWLRMLTECENRAGTLFFRENHGYEGH